MQILQRPIINPLPLCRSTVQVFYSTPLCHTHSGQDTMVYALRNRKKYYRWHFFRLGAVARTERAVAEWQRNKTNTLT
jgi:hypothetical protein